MPLNSNRVSVEFNFKLISRARFIFQVYMHLVYLVHTPSTLAAFHEKIRKHANLNKKYLISNKLSFQSKRPQESVSYKNINNIILFALLS